MKLYATTTSERASKGQGGNRYLKTVFTIDKQEDEQLNVNMRVRDDDNNIVDILIVRHNHIDKSKTIIYQDKFQIRTKGKNQKGEKCEHYGCGNFAESGSDYCIAH